MRKSADLFRSYAWPGNVRELRNVFERATIVCDRDLIGRAHLPADFGRIHATDASELLFRCVFRWAPRWMRWSVS
jgi:DNA-binding NtrC family response regulator